MFCWIFGLSFVMIFVRTEKKNCTRVAKKSIFLKNSLTPFASI